MEYCWTLLDRLEGEKISERMLQDLVPGCNLHQGVWISLVLKYQILQMVMLEQSVDVMSLILSNPIP
ncbi:hypothetical protein P8452_51559 [Trifolium repens]|nr:hypothetical protein P8452_51559 [Trifolium repens]